MPLDQTLLVAYADGELDAAAAREVERWIAGDAAARRQVHIFQTTRALLRAACGDAADEDVLNRSRDALRRR